MVAIKTSKEVEYDTKNTKRVLEILNKSVRGMTITEIAQQLGLNRHTVTKILERLLIEKKVNYDEKGPAKIFYSSGTGKFVGRIDQGKFDTLWIDVFKPKYPGEEEFVRINQTKHDHLIRASSKFRSVGAIAIKKRNLINLIRILKDVARDEFGLDI
ncbi:MAG TPA: winged helix-turn-helix transcriptional regulator [Candidatus Aenigmarchaeota archaeon]|nr:winged helix-turn-helix transcriptional regulator [Candidatus Aenigmarchaeota archaeon]